MAAWRTVGVVAGLLLGAGWCQAQTHNLSEAPKAGDCFRVEIETGLNGKLKVRRGDKPAEIPVTARNEHALVEKVLAEAQGSPRKVARHYTRARSTGTLGNDRSERVLGDDRRLIVAQRAEELLCYSPAGPLTQPELEVVSEHFDTFGLTGILPGKEVGVGDTWKLPNAAVQSLCLFEGLISHDLTGKFVGVQGGAAVIAVEGKASGIDVGALANLTVSATARYDLLKHRLVALEWKQSDVRDQGPASPASEVESVTRLKREPLEEEPKEVSRAALVGVPAEDDPPGLLKQLAHRDPKGRYSFLYGREWHVVGQTESHLVLRLLDRGDFIAQAVVTPFRPAQAGKHIGPDEFKSVVAESPGWEAEEIVDAAEVPVEEGRWCYRVTARGNLDGVKVVQSFYVLAGPRGEQVVVTFTMKPANAAKIGTRDVALVGAIDFAKK